ncbi:MAG: MFS transporter [Candidatus Heimdallarchaeota archaeon]|nr:MFS transporter [Candidatus Heimdallarchaeota archaeon]
MKFLRSLTIMIPISMMWLITAIFLLVYSLDLLETAPILIIGDIPFNPAYFILLITAIVATGALYGTGMIIDKNPEHLKSLIVISLVSIGISLFLVILGTIYFGILLIALPAMGFFLGVGTTATASFFSGFSEAHNRGRLYAGALFMSMFAVITIMLFAEFNFLDFHFPLILTGLLSILVALVFYVFSRSIDPWVNDKFPTKLQKILSRRPTKAYLISHYFIYVMLGFAFITIPEIGQIKFPNLLVDTPWFSIFQANQDKLFWLFVFFGDVLLVFPNGLIADHIGRKNLIIIGVYGIVLSALIVALSNNPFMFYLSAFILGGSFSTMHPTIDSTVWCDLSPLDSLGRYNALGFVMLLQGIGTGLLLGLFINPFITADSSNISYILFFFAVLSLLPLFYMNDSFPPLDIYLLLVTRSGMLLFDYDFHHKEQISQKDLALVAGALSAIDTFFEEIDEQHATLDLVRHGHVLIVQTRISTSKGDIIGTIFANKASAELQSSLNQFLVKFTKSHHSEIEKWVGQPNAFEKGIGYAEEIFGPLLPSKSFRS